MKIAFVTFPGSDYDGTHEDLVRVLGGEARRIWHRETDLGDADLVVVPGGSSYGDYLRPGAIARITPIMEAVRRFAEKGGPIIGMCNGFQILCEAGLLPGALIRNRSLRFRCFDAYIRVENASTAFTTAYEEGQVVRLPIAHGQGNYVADRGTIERLEGEGRVIFRYVDAAGNATADANPNGSMNNIAGIVNDRGNVLGLMPHPERALDPIIGSTDGVPLFESLRAHLTGVGSR